MDVQSSVIMLKKENLKVIVQKNNFQIPNPDTNCKK